MAVIDPQISITTDKLVVIGSSVTRPVPIVPDSTTAEQVMR